MIVGEVMLLLNSEGTEKAVLHGWSSALLFLSLIILITKNALLFDKQQEFRDGAVAKLASFKALPTFREIVFKGETFK